MSEQAMSDEYPLYPRLSPDGEKEAQLLFDGFKAKMAKICEETLEQLYCDVATHIESASWTNFRNDLLSGLRNYGNRKVQADYDFAQIRRAIFEEFRAEIISDINQDLLKEVEDLKKQLENEREYNRRRQ